MIIDIFDLWIDDLTKLLVDFVIIYLHFTLNIDCNFGAIFIFIIKGL